MESVLLNNRLGWLAFIDEHAHANALALLRPRSLTQLVNESRRAGNGIHPVPTDSTLNSGSSRGSITQGKSFL